MAGKNDHFWFNLIRNLFISWLVLSPTPQQKVLEKSEHEAFLREESQSQVILVANKPSNSYQMTPVREPGVSPIRADPSRPASPPYREERANKILEKNRKIKDGYPSPNGSSNPSGNDDGGLSDADVEKRIKEAEPNPDSVISNSEFWEELFKSKSSSDDSSSEDHGEDDSNEEDDVFVNLEDDLEKDDDYQYDPNSGIDPNDTNRRKLFANPNPPKVSKPTSKLNPSTPKASTPQKSIPTRKLDDLDPDSLTQAERLTAMSRIRSREGIEYSTDYRSIKKLIKGHSYELNLEDPNDSNLLECPIQTDPNKYQRKRCYQPTVTSIQRALRSVEYFLQTRDPKIITFDMPVNNQMARFYLDKETGNSIYFYIQGKQAKKLWSAKSWEPERVPELLERPEVDIVTDMDNNIFKEGWSENNDSEL